MDDNIRSDICDEVDTDTVDDTSIEYVDKLVDEITADFRKCLKDAVIMFFITSVLGVILGLVWMFIVWFLMFRGH